MFRTAGDLYRFSRKGHTLLEKYSDLWDIFKYARNERVGSGFMFRVDVGVPR